MLAFAVHVDGKLADKVNLNCAYVVGTDDVPLRADLTFKNGIITCKKRAAGPAGLALLWKVEGAGMVVLETIRVQERDRPYILQVELARGRLLRINHKLEDWGLLDNKEAKELLSKLDAARDVLIDALKSEDPAKAAALGDQALGIAVRTSEEIAKFHADGFLARRAQTAPKRLLGCGVNLDPPSEATRKRLTTLFDFVTVPIVWRDIEPTEQTFNWKALDTWVELLVKNQMPIRGSALLSFNEKNVPDWLYIWEHDFDTIRDLAFEHARRVINRYSQYIQNWVVISGIHANNCFAFSFEQLMELTRMTAALAKQLSPRGTALVEIAQPWGEYYARNQRTIPPLLYADMAVQSGVTFDAFGLRLEFGPGRDGTCVRDMFHIASMLDQFSKLGKPLHITGVQVPSGAMPRGEAADPAADGGLWRGPWSEGIQAEWLHRFAEIALSRQFVESIAWQTFVDHAGQDVPFGGLLRSDAAPKLAYQEVAAIRKDLQLPAKPPAQVR